MSITPTADRVLVEEEKVEQKTASGIIVPGNEDDSKRIGKVIAVGPGRTTDEGKNVELPLSVGQKVIFSWGDKVDHEGKEYYLVNESNILAIIS